MHCGSLCKGQTMRNNMAAVGLLQVLVAFFIGQVSVYGCPDGWTSHMGTCYIYMKELYNWFDSKSACETMGGKLVEINSPAENHFVADMIRTHGDQHPWTGLEDFAEEGVFVFATSRERPEQYFWGLHEPEDRFGHEDCAGMTGSGQWFDGTCDMDKRPFVCEMASDSGSIIG